MLSNQIYKITLVTGAALTLSLFTPTPAAAQFGLFKKKSETAETETVASTQEAGSVAKDSEEPVAGDASSDLQSDPQITGTGNHASDAEGNPVDSERPAGCTRYADQTPDETGFKKRGRFGKLGAFVGRMTRKIPLIGNALVDGSMRLTDAVACRLNPEEQKQAAEATEEATQSGEIGKTVTWASTSRDNVSGSSTIKSKDQLASGTICMTLADIIIVDGEELKVSKKMCRAPGETRFTIATT